MWFDSWSDLVRIVLVGVAAYAALLLVLRISGKRTLAKLNAFDLVVTVAFGSTLSSILLTTSVSWVDGAVALALLAGLQFLVAFGTSRSGRLRQIVTSAPTLVVRDGELLHDVMRRERLDEAELHQAVRSSGHGGWDRLAAVVLETDGSLSVIPMNQVGDAAALRGPRGPE